MTCPLCGKDVHESATAGACAKCPVNKGCKLIRCPNCGYEIPPAPRSLTFMKEGYNKIKAEWQRRTGNKGSRAKI